MKETIFVIGGCRSGKSRHALELAEQISGSRKTFLATLEPLDDEMKQRIALHQEQRGPDWISREAPIELPKALRENSGNTDVILVDCLTLWISNILMKTENQEEIFNYILKFLESVENYGSTLIIVSNEVGAGIVPENRLARLFRDFSGFLNQSVAACADRVIWMVAGIPVLIKSGK